MGLKKEKKRTLLSAHLTEKRETVLQIIQVAFALVGSSTHNATWIIETQRCGKVCLILL